MLCAPLARLAITVASPSSSQVCFHAVLMYSSRVWGVGLVNVLTSDGHELGLGGVVINMHWVHCNGV